MTTYTMPLIFTVWTMHQKIVEAVSELFESVIDSYVHLVLSSLILLLMAVLLLMAALQNYKITNTHSFSTCLVRTVMIHHCWSVSQYLKQVCTVWQCVKYGLVR